MSLFETDKVIFFHLTTATTKNGLGVISNSSIKKNELILNFRGEKIPAINVPVAVSEAEDRYLQIGPEEYLGPSGDIDDIVNHSCNPNCIVIIQNNNVYLKTIRRISTGEEITFDYSTTITSNDPWTMICKCNTKYCRQVIGSFNTLPTKQKLYYIKLGAVPQYVLIDESSRI